jgi:hypothetical protein
MKPAQPVPKALCQQRFPGCWSCWNYLVGVWKISNVSCPDPLENLCLSGTGGLERRKWVADVAQLCGACVNGTGPGYNQHQKASKWNMVLVLFSESRTLSQSVNKNTTDVKVWTTKCLRNEGNFIPSSLFISKVLSVFLPLETIIHWGKPEFSLSYIVRSSFNNKKIWSI